MESTVVNLSFFTKYPTQGATSRYRSFAFASKLAWLDYNVEINSFMDIGHLSNVFSKKPLNKKRLILAYLNRFFASLRSSENMIIERELLPLVPFFVEKWLLSGKKYILDFDDNVWEDYRGKRWLCTKYDSLVKNASGVIVGNEFLFEKVSKLNANVLKVPTVIDLELYDGCKPEKNKTFTIVWIGSPVTYKYILEFGDVFREAARRVDFELCIIASKELYRSSIEGVNMSFFDWSNESEIEHLKKAHIGIMPLTSDNFSLGKSGFKLIQYLAAGLCCIASPVGENKIIVKHGYNGILAHSKDEWVEAIVGLSKNRQLLSKFSANAKESAFEFSIQKYFPIYREFIDNAFATEDPREHAISMFKNDLNT